VLTLLLVPALCALGFWQLDRADQKREMRREFAERGENLELRITGEAVDAQVVRFAKVTATGHYDPRHQFFVANRIHDRQVGYEVVTPLEVDGGATRVLVNRGWVPQGGGAAQPPQVDTPTARVTVYGRAVVPEPNVFARAFESVPDGEAPVRVRTVLDIAALRSEMPFPLQPFVVLLDPDAAAGGFVREWPQLDRQPDLMPERNMSYAVQWFAMAAAVMIIFIVMGMRRQPAQPTHDAKDD
jgi:surfeit locus 1 family protein